MSSGNIVKLNIGGTVFQTTKSTLTKFDGFFKTMLETDIPLEKDESECIFIGRDPKHFRMILNFMRDGTTVIPKSEEDRQEMMKEAQYYLLDGLDELCNTPSNQLRIIESDAHLLNLIALSQETEKPVIYYRVDGENRNYDMPTFNFRVFIEKNKNRFDIWSRSIDRPIDGNGHAPFYRIFSDAPNYRTYGDLRFNVELHKEYNSYYDYWK